MKQSRSYASFMSYFSHRDLTNFLETFQTLQSIQCDFIKLLVIIYDNLHWKKLKQSRSYASFHVYAHEFPPRHFPPSLMGTSSCEIKCSNLETPC